MEKLKRQLELATGGDKQRIAQLISIEEKKYKANLWFERAQQVYDEDEKIKAYKKAMELNPDMPQVYLGIAKILKGYEVMPENEEEKKKKLDNLKEALNNINMAISLDENNAEAYALRAEILYEMKWLERYDEVETDEKNYNDKIFKDINRALALNTSNKGELYYESYYIS